VVRTAYQALAAVLGGTQSLHTNSYDEALGLPSEEAATLALRTQQILAYETGVTATVDPLAGSYYVEALTDEVEAAASTLIDEIDRRGGAVGAIEAGYQQHQIEEAAFRHARAVDAGDVVVVGVNRFAGPAAPSGKPLVLDPEVERAQVAALAERRAARDEAGVARGLAALEQTARRDGGNLLYPMKEALAREATVGEVSAVLGSVFGRYRPT